MTESGELNVTSGRAYIDALYEITPDLKVEAAAFGTHFSTGRRPSENRFEPRAGVAWAPPTVTGCAPASSGSRQRSAHRRPGRPSACSACSRTRCRSRSTAIPTPSSRAGTPSGTVTASPSVDYQHQDLTNFRSPNPGLIDTHSTDRRQPRSRERDGQCLAGTWLRHFRHDRPPRLGNETPGFSGPLPFFRRLLGGSA